MSFFHSGGNSGSDGTFDLSATTTVSNKIKSMTYTASTIGVTNIVHGLNYVPLTDELSVIDTSYDSVLTEGIECTNSINIKEME